MRLYDVQCRTQAPQVIASLSQLELLDQATPPFSCLLRTSGLSRPLSGPREWVSREGQSITMHAIA